VEKEPEMEQTAGTEAAGHLIDVQSSAMVDGLKIMEALSNEDSVNLFFYAKDGIGSSTDAIRALRLTQKRYYTRLKLLLDAGLIEKTDDGYRHTYLGTLVHKLGVSLLKIVENKDQLSVLDSIRKSGDISLEETNKIAKVLSIDLPHLDVRTEDVKMISTYEDLVKITTNLVKDCKESILMATKYIEIRVIDASINAIDRGVKVKGVVEKMDQFTSGIKLVFTILSNPLKIKSFLNFLNSENLEIRFSKFPYTFYIIDRKYSLIEIKNPITDDFQFAVFISNEEYSGKMLTIFDSLWNTSSKLKGDIKL